MERRAKKEKNTAVLLLGAAVLLLLTAALWLGGRDAQPQEEPLAQVAGTDVVRLQDGAELMQTLTYTRCEHAVTRRLTAPVELFRYAVLGKGTLEWGFYGVSWLVTLVVAVLGRIRASPRPNST